MHTVEAPESSNIVQWLYLQENYGFIIQHLYTEHCVYYAYDKLFIMSDHTK